MGEFCPQHGEVVSERVAPNRCSLVHRHLAMYIDRVLCLYKTIYKHLHSEKPLWFAQTPGVLGGVNSFSQFWSVLSPSRLASFRSLFSRFTFLSTNVWERLRRAAGSQADRTYTVPYRSLPVGNKIKSCKSMATGNLTTFQCQLPVAKGYRSSRLLIGTQ
jgi:hypothetical protein